MSVAPQDPQPSLAGQALCGDLPPGALEALFARFGVAVVTVPEGAPIPGSYWGEPEAGLRGATLFVRGDTPVHSALHEGCHSIVMGPERRAHLDTDAGGEDLEESAVCYLQILLANHLPGIGRQRLCRDMDAWGYSFRLGSTRAWFEEDAADAREWLVTHGFEATLTPPATPPSSCHRAAGRRR